MDSIILKRLRNIAIVFFFGITTILSTGCITNMFADKILYPARQVIVKTPSDYGLKHQDISITTEDGITLKGWIIPTNTSRLVIMTHPMGFTKYGYSTRKGVKPYASDTEVEFLNTAKQLYNNGFSVLMFDFRNHGESGYSKDKISGVGLNEYKDIVAVIRYIQNDPMLNNKKTALLSFCMGANSSIVGFTKDPSAFSNITCLIAVQPVSVKIFTDYYTRNVYGNMIAGLLPKVEKRCIEKGGYPFDKMSALLYSSNLFVPTLYVQAKADKWISTNFIQQVYKATPEPKEIFWLGENKLRFDTYNYFGNNPKVILEFLNKYMPENN